MKTFILLLSVVAASLSAFADRPKAISLTDAERTFVTENSDFAFRLFRTARTDKSVVLSPLSITYALGMLNNGATGETQQQINRVLGGSPEVINSFCRKMIDASNSLDTKTKVLISDNIYVNAARGYHLLPDFVQSAHYYYDATPETRDFYDGATREAINQWASDHTEGMIKEPLREDEFDPAVVSYLLNALYFNSEWALPFDKASTQKIYFDEGKATADMMAQYETFQYAENDVCQSIQLPYGNGAFLMTVFLPRLGKTLDGMIATMSGSDWNTMEYEPYRVSLHLPRFETDTDQRLESVMSELGMPRAFDPIEAQFDKFAVNDQQPDDALHIDFMKQVAKIRVNESGTEAAAVTIIGMKENSAGGKYAEFFADRPFLYVISERSTGTIFFLGQYMGEPLTNVRHDISLTAEERHLVDNNNDFAFRLFDKARGPESSIMSPLSITYALGMLNNGAAGQTQQEINRVLGSTGAGSADAVNGFCRKLLTEAPTLDKETTAAIANTVYVNSHWGFELQQGFKDKAREYYDATPEARDFYDGETMGVINQWASDRTHGMIPKVFTEDSFNKDAASYLLNAIYFKGAWANKFDKAETKDELFNKSTAVPMMHQYQEFEYTDNDLYQAVRLPYGNGAFQMTVFLPREGKTIGDVLSQLDGHKWNDLYYGMYYVDLKLPRLNTDTSLPLEDIMKELGMPRAFDPWAAEFPYFGNQEVFISNMFQKAAIDLDEEGTTAAAVTVVGETATAMPQEAKFYADRPFFYIISEQSTNAIFFIGQYLGSVTAGVDAPLSERETPSDSRVYDLQGRRLDSHPAGRSPQLKRGLYIKGGKKYMVN